MVDERKRLNLQVSESVSNLRSSIKEFEIRAKFYRNLFKGKGLDFDGYRSYSKDDDSSLIDWKASKRTNKLLVKEYVEERDLKVLFVVDVSDNMLMGSSNKLKAEYAGEMACALANLVISSGDQLGFVLFSDRVKKFVIPRKGLNNFYLFEDLLSDVGSYGGHSDFSSMADFIDKNIDKSFSAIIIISDFLNMGIESKKYLDLIGDRFETFALVVRDKIDSELPDVSGEIVLEAPGGGSQLLINPKLVAHSYRIRVEEQKNTARNLLKSSGIDFLELTTDKDFVPELVHFLRERVEMR